MLTIKKINLTAERLKSLDPQDILGKTLELPDQLRKGFAIGSEFADKNELKKIEQLDWHGLGGSAVAGDLLRGFGIDQPEVPLTIRVIRGKRYSAGTRIVASYSGNTIESVQALDGIHPQQVWFTMSSGGKLRQLSQEMRIPHLLLPGGYPPRTAVGFALGAMLAVFKNVYKIKKNFDLIWKCLDEDSKQYRDFDRETNPALEIAASLIDRTPLIYSVDGRLMPSVAMRFNCQLNENSKVWSHTAEFPELAHNEVEALGSLRYLLPAPQIFLLGSWDISTLPDPRPEFRKLLDELGIGHRTFDPIDLWGASSDRLLVGLRTMLILDAISVYLGVLRATDPFEIPLITRLKTATFA